MTGTSDRVHTKPTPKRPGNRWRNLYWTWELIVTGNGVRYEPGENLGHYVWPSCEIAEARAMETVQRYRGIVEYLCSVEVED
ncbi:MAG: hypothetical protein GC206_15415 [Alphaproteobacteria bacterium]|nr:hypothetical protein [Alphaproteobacteria bacterium]